jgi:hypothetical protein
MENIAVSKIVEAKKNLEDDSLDHVKVKDKVRLEDFLDV